MRGRIRALTKKPLLLEAMAKGVVGEVQAFMDIHLDRGLQVMRTYPPPKVGSSYTRTNRYKLSWRRSDVKLGQQGLVGTLQNDMPYALYVGGNEQGVGQQQQHAATGWPLFALVLRLGFTEGVKRAMKRGLES